jgi:Txe/YoeB family toxin of Txe-Axe toxin-antitoxin module
MKQQQNFQYTLKLSPGLLKKERFHLSKLEEVFALKNNLFATSLKPIDSTMVGAWSRQCEIQQEIVYAA